MSDYPKMLYRPGKGDGEIVWGHRLDTMTVQSSAEHEHALRQGWKDDPNKAIKRLGWHFRGRALRDFYLRNWQWLWGTAVATALALHFGR